MITAAPLAGALALACGDSHDAPAATGASTVATETATAEPTATAAELAV